MDANKTRYTKEMHGRWLNVSDGNLIYVEVDLRRRLKLAIESTGSFRPHHIPHFVLQTPNQQFVMKVIWFTASLQLNNMLFGSPNVKVTLTDILAKLAV